MCTQVGNTVRREKPSGTYQNCIRKMKTSDGAVQAEPAVIDGSLLEGGGQILRISSALSAILGIPIKIHSIRAGRSTPGLRPQHLTSLKLTRDLTNGTLTGDTIGSTEVTLIPGKISGGDYSVDTRTAGSITLIIQAILPCLLFGKTRTIVKMRGGTNVGMAPPIDYTTEIFQTVVKKFGVQFSCHTLTRGFYPRGGGEVHLTVEPVISLQAAVLDQPQMLKSVRGVSFVAGTLPIRIANEMRDSASKHLHSVFGDIPIDIKSFKDSKSFGNGTAIILVGETNDDLVLGGSGLGEPKVPAFQVGEHAARELVESASRKVCLDQYAQDQVIIFMALAEGTSRVLVGPLTLHTQTAIHVTSLLTGAKFSVVDQKTQPETFVIECQGIGFVNSL